MENGNIGLVLELPVTQLQIEGSFEKIYFTFLIEYVQDYPLSPPKVHIIEPDLDPTQTPHMFIDNTICYLKPDEDWSSNYSSYDVGLMIKSWIFAYLRWKQKGIWGWREHEEPQPGPI
jgi:ubiquitin-protein ligase